MKGFAPQFIAPPPSDSAAATTTGGAADTVEEGDAGASAGSAIADAGADGAKQASTKASAGDDDADGWNGAWDSDGDDNGDGDGDGDGDEAKATVDPVAYTGSRIISTSRMTFARSQLATLLLKTARATEPEESYEAVAKYLASLRPSALDVEVSGWFVWLYGVVSCLFAVGLLLDVSPGCTCMSVSLRFDNCARVWRMKKG